MAITTRDTLIAAYATAQRMMFTKASQTSEGAGTYHSLWKAAGNPAAGANPGSTGVVPTSATQGAFPFVDPTGGDLSYLGNLRLASSTIGTFIIYDRLFHVSGLSGTQTTVDTAVSNTALTRFTTGEQVELWAEVYTAMGATGATLNCKYTDQSGNTNQAGTYVMPANALSVGQMVPIALAAGDTGVRAVTNYHWSVSTGTAGDFGFTLLRRIAEIEITLANVGKTQNAIDLGLSQIPDDACLAFMVLCTATSTGQVMGSMDIIQG